MRSHCPPPISGEHSAQTYNCTRSYRGATVPIRAPPTAPEVLRMRHPCAPFAPILVALILVSARSSADPIHIAWWNVENLFDTADDPAVVGDEEFTPAGPKK